LLNVSVREVDDPSSLILDSENLKLQKLPLKLRMRRSPQGLVIKVKASRTDDDSTSVYPAYLINATTKYGQKSQVLILPDGTSTKANLKLSDDVIAKSAALAPKLDDTPAAELSPKAEVVLNKSSEDNSSKVDSGPAIVPTSTPIGIRTLNCQYRTVSLRPVRRTFTLPPSTEPLPTGTEVTFVTSQDPRLVIHGFVDVNGWVSFTYQYCSDLVFSYTFSIDGYYPVTGSLLHGIYSSFLFVSTEDTPTPTSLPRPPTATPTPRPCLDVIIYCIPRVCTNPNERHYCTGLVPTGTTVNLTWSNPNNTTPTGPVSSTTNSNGAAAFRNVQACMNASGVLCS